LSDPRLTPARADVAAAHLKGQVEAARFVEGDARQVRVAAASIRRAPAPDAGQETQALFGEIFTIYDEKDGWAWGQAQLDSYVGYVLSSELTVPIRATSHRVIAPRTLAFSEPNLKSRPAMVLPVNAKLAIDTEDGKYKHAAGAGWTYAPHVAPLDARVTDWVGEAEKLIGAPYLWGGKSADGYDCSGLIQTALERAGIACLRDTDMQEKSLGQSIAVDFSALKRGDLIFWKGHMGVMLDGARLLHANAFHMATAVEPLGEAVTRIEAAGYPVTSVKRL
jgi:cell wall-associated NlpC family hydrolase